MIDLRFRLAAVPGLALALGLAACSGQGGSNGPGAPPLLGFGTPSVSTYMPEDQATSLQALLDRCQQVPPQAGSPSETQGLPAACGQLHRTIGTQPGNTVPAAGAR